MAGNEVTVDGDRLMRKVTMTVRVKFSGIMKVRLRVAVILIWLASVVAGCSLDLEEIE